MSDVYVNIIMDARDKLGISVADMCEGVYTADMFYLVEHSDRDMDRVIAKRLLARLGVDNGNYEHYLDYPAYEAWRRRMRLINCIEDDKLDEAEQILAEYMQCFAKIKDSRKKIEKQFYLFMKLQLLKHKGEERDNVYEAALKLTVPNIDKKPVGKLILSPLEVVLVLEYKRRQYINASMDEKLQFYEELLEYVENAPLGKVSIIKVYPKICVSMYRDICAMMSSENNIKIYEKMLEYCENALSKVKDRKFMYYLTEILEIRLELLSYFKEKGLLPCGVDDCEKSIQETTVQLEALKKLYEEYGICAYMRDDCYLYRESGIYCINEVVETRRTMMGITMEDISSEDIATTTVWRIEKKHKAVRRKTMEILFDRLSLYPSCVNTGIVTDKKEAVELFEELRYAILLFENDAVKELLVKLRKILPEHPINRQVLLRIESFNDLRMGEKDNEQHIKTLQEALECTVKLKDIQNAKKIFITTEELTALYLISAMYKDVGEHEKALLYIKELHNYCKEMEDEDLVDGRMGIYELVMTHVASLYGDIGRYEESNNISEKLINIGLKLKRGNSVHSNLYSIAWNNDAAKKSGYDYNAQVQRCINFSRLLGDTYDEAFYRENLKPIV